MNDIFLAKLDIWQSWIWDAIDISIPLVIIHNLTDIAVLAILYKVMRNRQDKVFSNDNTATFSWWRLNLNSRAVV